MKKKLEEKEIEIKRPEILIRLEEENKLPKFINKKE